jgi:hypothetical protein
VEDDAHNSALKKITGNVLRDIGVRPLDKVRVCMAHLLFAIPALSKGDNLLNSLLTACRFR